MEGREREERAEGKGGGWKGRMEGGVLQHCSSAVYSKLTLCG